MWITIRAMLTGALRDRISLFWALLFPIILLVGLGSYFPDPVYHRLLLTGMLALAAVFFSLSGTAFEVMRQRRQGVYKLLRATPFPTPAFVSGLTAARGAVSLLCAVIVLTAGLLLFHIDIKPAHLLLALPVMALGILCFSLLGFVVGNLGNNETQVAGLNNLLTLPMMFGSSVFYSLDRAPEWIKAFSQWTPLSPFLDALRAAMSGDATGMVKPLLFLLGFTALSLLLAIGTFRWEPDGPVIRPIRLRV
jgi:ABC-2 type transport system permease protein